MASKVPATWLDRVARILMSKSGDLRGLAELAELDPATMYLGTRLDGADLRGQDLRGMSFTNLDLARVRVDASTRLGNVREYERDAILARGLIYFADTKLVKAYERAPDRVPFRNRFFFKGELAAFWDACQSHVGPKLIVGFAGAGPEPRRYRQDDRSGDDVIEVLIVDDLDGQVHRHARDLSEELARPTVLVPVSTNFEGRRRPSLPRELCDAIGLFLDQWEIMFATLSEAGMAFFLSRPRGQSRPDSAWWQLVGMTVILDLDPRSGQRFESLGEPPSSSASLAFPELKPHRVPHEHGWPAFEAAIMIGSTGPARGAVTRGYEATVKRLLAANGWKVGQFTGPVSPESSPNPEPDFAIDGKHLQILVEVTVRSRSAPQRFPIRLADRDLATVAGLRVGEYAPAAAIMQALADEDRLLVNLEDLSSLEADARNLWLLVANQARRIVRTASERHLRIYIASILRSAIRAHPIHAKAEERLIERVMNDELLGQMRCSVEVLDWESSGVAFKVVLRPLAQAPRASEPHFILGIDEDGPRIYWKSRRPARGA